MFRHVLRPMARLAPPGWAIALRKTTSRSLGFADQVESTVGGIVAAADQTGLVHTYTRPSLAGGQELASAPYRLVSTLRRRPGLRIAGLFAAYLGLYAAAQVVFGPRPPLFQLVLLPVDAAAVLLALRAARRTGTNARLSRAWQLLAATFSCYLAGDVVFTVQRFGASPPQSVEAIFYAAAIVCALAALIHFPAKPVARGERLRLGLDLAGVALGGVLAIVYLIIGVAPHSATIADGTFIAASYAVAALMLGVAVAAVVLRGYPPTLRLPLQAMAAGLLLLIALNTVWSFRLAAGNVEVGGLLDLLRLAGISCFGVAAALQRRPDTETVVVESPRRVSLLPYAALVAGLIVLVASDWGDPFFPDRFATSGVALLAILAAARQFIAQRELARERQRASERAETDELTGLGNRRMLFSRLNEALPRARRSGRDVALLLLDLDGFKLVNDTLGHQAGDELLREFAGRLRSIVRDGELAARLGGDEFCLVAEGRLPAAALATLADRMLTCFQKPIAFAGVQRHVTGSLGIAVAEAGDGDPLNLLQNADAAMYQAKQSGGGYRLFEPDLRRMLTEQAAIAEALADAADQHRRESPGV